MSIANGIRLVGLAIRDVFMTSKLATITTVLGGGESTSLEQSGTELCSYGSVVTNLDPGGTS